ncbi:peptide-methionine (S)-S-oxide reductase MsrA [Fodinicola feengrottensis]|uniref:peptide-methionine (S)-S-oxide reductase MsrA n=1 Tax=Fodinicola feengrottensis TaxID=435914 RepID=UPI002442389D|nr:peptide-methionine (S)-S-oxide reductase MsrA [Fodinicola feengrottensis]
MFGFRRSTMVEPADALPGRPEPIVAPERHTVLGTPLTGPWPEGLQVAVFGMGCFWGAERIFWQMPGVYSTSVGYAGGYTPNPTYEETCSGRTGHTEAVQVVYDPARVSYEQLLKAFFENHPDAGQPAGQRRRQPISLRDLHHHPPEQEKVAKVTLDAFQPIVTASGHGQITTEIKPLDTFYYAEDYHQQYLDKVPNGYCNHGPNGLSCPIGVAKLES